jgi:hypothetical protein
LADDDVVVVVVVRLVVEVVVVRLVVLVELVVVLVVRLVVLVVDGDVVVVVVVVVPPPPPVEAPLTVKPVGTGLLPLKAPWKPNDTLPPEAIEPLYPTFVAETTCPLWVAVAPQAEVTA